MTDERLKARDLAERCFALARSTTFPAERDSAIGRGTAICEKAGLSLDQFDIPGRARPAQAKPSGAFDFETAGDPRTNSGPHSYYDAGRRGNARPFFGDAAFTVDMEALFREMAASQARSKHDFQRQRDDARKEREAREKAEAQQLARWPTAKACVDFLFMRGCPVYPIDSDDGDWFAPGQNGDRPMDDGELRDLADKWI